MRGGFPYSGAYAFQGSYDSLWRMVILNSAIRQYTQWLWLQGMLNDSSVSVIQYSQFAVGQPTRMMLELQILTQFLRLPVISSYLPFFFLPNLFRASIVFRCYLHILYVVGAVSVIGPWRSEQER